MRCGIRQSSVVRDEVWHQSSVVRDEVWHQTELSSYRWGVASDRALWLRRSCGIGAQWWGMRSGIRQSSLVRDEVWHGEGSSMASDPDQRLWIRCGIRQSLVVRDEVWHQTQLSGSGWGGLRGILKVYVCTAVDAKLLMFVDNLDCHLQINAKRLNWITKY